MEVKVSVEICREGITLPFYANESDAGMDICAAKEVIIKPGQTAAIPTGLKFAIPCGYEIQVRPRSGISLRTPLRLPNAPGTIDSGYRDELFILMCNTSNLFANYDVDKILTLAQEGMGTYIINPNDRIAQIFINPVPRINFEVVSSVQKIGYNRGGGFGSTGINSAYSRREEGS